MVSLNTDKYFPKYVCNCHVKRCVCCVNHFRCPMNWRFALCLLYSVRNFESISRSCDMLKCPCRPEIWQTSRQHCYRCICHISVRWSDNAECISLDFWTPGGETTHCWRTDDILCQPCAILDPEQRQWPIECLGQVVYMYIGFVRKNSTVQKWCLSNWQSVFAPGSFAHILIYGT